MPYSALISLLTDFGCQDAYVGTMKGVIYGINPDVEVVDLCHEVSAQDVNEAAYILKTAYRYFPAGTIHVAVVDPGVGTSRRAVAFSAGDWFFIGPDNGIFSYVLRDEKLEEAVELTDTDYQLERVGETFHGRDVFAPAAAYIAGGVELRSFGPAVSDLVRIPDMEPDITDDRVVGRIIHIDHFGNCITNIEQSHITNPPDIHVSNILIDRISDTYADVPPNRPLALFGSSQHLEIAVNSGNAALDLGISKGDQVVCRWVKTP